MSSEKIEALSASAAAVAGNLGDVGRPVSQSAMDEMATPSRPPPPSPQPPRPQAAATAQYNYAVGWWGRAAGQMLTLNTELLKAQADAMKPIHTPPSPTPSG